MYFSCNLSNRRYDWRPMKKQTEKRFGNLAIDLLANVCGLLVRQSSACKSRWLGYYFFIEN